MTLPELREAIDKLDDELLRLLNERARLVQEVGRLKAELKQPFYVHLALAATATTQDEIQRRLEAEGIPVRVRDHGYCKSIYATDPDGLVVEFTSDPPDADRIHARARASAHADLQRWMAGDRRVNNDIRPHD